MVRLLRLAIRAVLVSTVVLALGSAVCADDGFAFGGDVSVGTDYMYRGISQSMSAAVLQACVEFAHESGWSGYAWGSNVDFVPDGGIDDGARLEINVGLAYELAVSDRVAVSLERVAYFFPGLEDGLDYSFSEWIGVLSLDERHRVTIGYPSDAAGSGEPGLYIGAGTGVALPAGLSVDVEVGQFEVDGFGGSYLHGMLAISGAVDTFTWQLAYHGTDSRARAMFHPSTAEPTLVLTLNWPLGKEGQ